MEAVMSHDFLSILQKKEPTFSKGQKRIARYITDSYDKAAFMTANRLGKTVGVSESTVVRFAVDLGFDGYPSMQKAMQEMVLNRLTSVQRIGVASDRYSDQDVVSMVLHSDMDKLRQTDENLSRTEFQAAVNAILKAKRIYRCKRYNPEKMPDIKSISFDEVDFLSLQIFPETANCLLCAVKLDGSMLPLFKIRNKDLEKSGTFAVFLAEKMGKIPIILR